MEDEEKVEAPEVEEAEAPVESEGEEFAPEPEAE